MDLLANSDDELIMVDKALYVLASCNDVLCPIRISVRCAEHACHCAKFKLFFQTDLECRSLGNYSCSYLGGESLGGRTDSIVGMAWRCPSFRYAEVCNCNAVSSDECDGSSCSDVCGGKGCHAGILQLNISTRCGIVTSRPVFSCYDCPSPEAVVGGWVSVPKVCCCGGAGGSGGGGFGSYNDHSATQPNLDALLEDIKRLSGDELTDTQIEALVAKTYDDRRKGLTSSFLNILQPAGSVKPVINHTVDSQSAVIDLDAKPIPPAPTVVELAANFTTAMHRWTKAGFKTVDEVEFTRRSDICSTCAHWDSQAYLGVGKCKLCGCAGGKRWLATEKCPIDKW